MVSAQIADGVQPSLPETLRKMLLLLYLIENINSFSIT